MNRLTAVEVIRLLDLSPLDFEGGYFRRTYAHSHAVQAEALPGGYHSARPLASAIYYLLTSDTCSRLHRLPTDELWHFYLGDPVALHVFQPAPGSRFRYTGTILGPDLQSGHKVQTTVPAQAWFGAHLVDGGDWALLGCTLAPAFADEDFQAAPPEIVHELLDQHPRLAGILARIT